MVEYALFWIVVLGAAYPQPAPVDRTPALADAHVREWRAAGCYALWIPTMLAGSSLQGRIDNIDYAAIKSCRQIAAALEQRVADEVPRPRRPERPFLPMSPGVLDPFDPANKPKPPKPPVRD